MIKVEQFSAMNQFLINTDKGVYFQSYDSIIAFKPYDIHKPVELDETYWDYSNTTGKFRNKFLHETKVITMKKIRNGTYILTDLN